MAPISTFSAADNDDNRCRINDGRRWRCPLPRFGSSRWCEKHHLCYLERKSKSKSRARVSDPRKKVQEIGDKRRVEEEKLRKSTRENKGKRKEYAEEVLKPRRRLKLSEKGRRRAKAKAVEERGSNYSEEGVRRVVALGEIWAFADDSDGFPRSYARIDSIIPVPSLVKATLLVPQPEETEAFVNKGLSLACGVFRASESVIKKDISAFTYRVEFGIDGEESSSYRIFPRKGEVWAVYLRWNGLEKKFEYKLAEVVSDFSEEDGVNVYGLVGVEGKEAVYRRQVVDGFYLVRTCSRKFMPMFSHKVPASKIDDGDDLSWKVTGY